MHWWREIDKLLYVTPFCDYVACYLCAVITEIVLLFAPTLFLLSPLLPLFTRQCAHKEKSVHTFLLKRP